MKINKKKKKFFNDYILPLISIGSLILSFILASNIDPKDIKYFLQITSWDETGVSIFVNFTDPMLASRGEERDLLELTIKRP